jgi:hypothetical protein
VTPDDYCRGLEAHLTRKNDGHLIRIVGPAFELVRGWAEQGIPFKIACLGIDRAFERYHAKGPRRRPLQIGFCTADVLDAFDDWRRAVGVLRHTGDEARPARRREGLAIALTRAIARLTALRSESAGSGGVRVGHDVLEDVVRALDRLAVTAEGARGRARDQVRAELAALDARLIEAARHGAEPSVIADLERQADEELRPFRDRMAADAWRDARIAARDRLLREQARLPTLTGDI